MVKKWRSCLSLLVSFAFILSMLFSATLEVSAAGVGDFLKSQFFYDKTSTFYSESSLFASNFQYIDRYGGKITMNSQNVGRYDAYADGFVGGHIKIPYVFEIGDNGQSGWDFVYNNADWDINAYYYVSAFTISMVYSWSDGSTTRACQFKNINFLDSNGRVFGSYSGLGVTPVAYSFIRGRELMTGSSNTRPPLNINGYLEFDFVVPSDFLPTQNLSLIFHPSFHYNMFSLKDEFKYDVGSISVTDSITQQELSTLNQSTSEINDSVTNPSGGGILGTIKNFFNGFFGWLHDTILGLFVPDSNYFTTWFTNVNTLLSDKLGMLYAPLDLLISTLNAVYSASSDFTGVPFPEIRWGDTVLVSSQNLTFSNLLGEHFEDIQGYVYFGTDVVLLFAFLMLLQRKITLVLRGHESG